MSELPAWIQPGTCATLIWYEAVQRGGDGSSVYQVSGPALEKPPATAYYLMAPLERSEFAGRLYRGEVTLPELRGFLQACTLAEGRMVETCEWVLARADTPALPLLDAWLDLADPPPVPYYSDISAFIPNDLPVHVSAEAYAAAQRSTEAFSTAWVCQECGDADDLGVFFWTQHRERRVRVCLLIQNETGLWTCQLHPFEFERQDIPLPSGETPPSPRLGSGQGEGEG